MPQYVRTSMMPYFPDGLHEPTKIDWTNKTFEIEGDTEWNWIKEGDENLLSAEFDGYTWKIDQSRGLLRETVVKDYAVRFLEEKGQWNPDAKWAATTTELTIDEHVKTMAVFAKYIDSAMSKTVNIPNDYPYEEFKRLYMDVYNTGVIKGCTTYRAGTMTEVLGSLDKKEEKEGIVKTKAPARPQSLDCDIYHVTAQGERWIVLVGLFEGEPFEVFAFKPKSIHLPSSIKNGKLTKVKRGLYNLECDNGLIIENIGENFETDEQEALTRMISTALRHGADIQFVFEQLNKANGTITSFAKAVGRSLKRYLKDGEKAQGVTCDSCESSNVVYQEGCHVCLDCGSGKCS
jgi:ribonucleoside-diphosphate reductase alpha chain